MKFSVSLLCLATLAAATTALDTIVTKGSKFFNSKSGEQFFIKGVAYQPRNAYNATAPDPLADVDTCVEQAAKFKELGLNLIRVYEVQNGNDHSKCMKALADNGIYLLLDVMTPKMSINRDEPEYTAELFTYVKEKVDEFVQYDNLFGFVAGNEVTNEVKNTDASAYVKALLRDIKKHLKDSKHNYPVGYATNDDTDINDDLKSFFACGKVDVRADFYGINIYRWCGSDSSFSVSGFDKVVESYNDYPIPVFLSEYGCNKKRPRAFDEVESIYGSDMTGSFSGGVMYEYTEEDNEYGIVNLNNPNDKTAKEEFENFKDKMTKVKPQGVKSDSSDASVKEIDCPAASNSTWRSSENLPPTPVQASCTCVYDTLPCVPKDPNTKDFGDKVGEHLGYICGNSASSCSSITADPVSGEYGKYSFCDAKTKAAVAMSAYYKAQKNSADACDFDGFAEVVKPKSSDDSKCSDLEDPKSSSSGKKNSSDDSGAASLTTSFTGAVAMIALTSYAFYHNL
ncbi:1 3-beta-glucanosyltransferase gel4 [Dimargaris verticillata]|uniref:1,3-beta-glucanosyltransferase n=1 Tax=Dimargaris verticillata TaxID=2761393 RepID=A0A9W8ECR5_9FUNG|nr:1 3-beta-glucanosyltransferase gel4 [Dimargaris verticillata]